MGWQLVIVDLAGTFDTVHWQAGWIQQANLHKNPGLIPVDVFVGNLSILEANDDDHCHLDFLTSRRDTRQQPVYRCGVCKTDDKFFHHLIVADGARDIHHFHVRWEEFADKMVTVEIAHPVSPHSTRQYRHMIEIRMVGHCGHCGFEITAQFRVHVLLEQVNHGLLCRR